MRHIDTGAYSAQKPTRIKPEKVDLRELPPIEKPPREMGASQPKEDARPQQSATERNSERKSERTHERTLLRARQRPNDLPIKRRTKRYSFEFYQDQLVKLKQLKIRAEMNGESLSLSEMARDAFDTYLSDKVIDGEN